MPTFQVVNIEDVVKPYFDFTLPKNKMIFYGILGTIVIFGLLSMRKSYKNNCDGTATKYIIQEDEICADCVYYTYPNNKVKHILWTGGYDSTFLLCWYFIVRDEPVQPIYLMCNNLDSKFGIIGRQNQEQEMKIMKKIRKMLIEKYPYKKSRLLPTYYVYSIEKDNKLTSKFIKLHRKYKFFSRDINQYERIMRFSNTWHQPLHIGLEKCGTGLDEATIGNRIDEGTDTCMIKPNPTPVELSIFNNIRFSICHLTKEDMKQISLDSSNYFYNILELTVSCWYPTAIGAKNGKCGGCPMCKGRII
jgi:hypothetical protein